MSGTIRSSIAPSLNRLKGYIEEVRPIINAAERTDEGVDLLQKTIVKIRRVIIFLDEKVENVIDILEIYPLMRKLRKKLFLVDMPLRKDISWNG